MRETELARNVKYIKMKLIELDPNIRAILRNEWRKLSNKQNRVKSKRINKGVPISPSWEQNWRDFKHHHLF